MAWTEISRETTIITTRVKFDFMDEPVDIPHYVGGIDPSKIEEQITVGINNREETEKNKLNNLE